MEAQLQSKKKSKQNGIDRIALQAIGMEAEFALIQDGIQARPEDVFGSPKNFIREAMMHRTGKSYHLPTGGAIYFDTGVVEVATPVIELERGCAARAGRSLWEGILFVRKEMDAWEREKRTNLELAGFSTHYNISFEQRNGGETVEKLARLLTYILPAPVMLLAANRKSTGIGVRPRGNRIEITADFTPSAPLMIATATVIVGIVCEVMSWDSYDLSVLDDVSFPVFRDLHPMPHTSRKGWLARYDCYPANPFASDIDAQIWNVRGTDRSMSDTRKMSLREMAGRTTRYFWDSIRSISDPFTLQLIGSVMRGRAPSLLDLEDRPSCYDSVGRMCGWDNLFPERVLPRSRYERVLIHAIAGEKLHIGGRWYTPVGMKGWSGVVFRRDDNTRHVFSLDYLLSHLRDWERRIYRQDRVA